MAARNQLRVLRNHPGLSKFCIPSERIIYKKDKHVQLGVGSYGRVVELDIHGTICAGKMMHEVLVAQGRDSDKIAQKYVEECKLMSDIRHPNVVQFLGLCFLPGESSLPVLVLELLLTSFDDLLEKKPKKENRIPLCIKRSILADVAKGLIYLHNHDPPVIHRDLSARNVLLNSSMQAKISDLGNARIIDLRIAQKSMTRMPGAPTYMPPEASEGKPEGYGPQLDSFSFGHLTLFAVTQIFPDELLCAAYPDPENPGCVIGRTEIERRQEYIKLLHQQLERRHPLVQLVNQCLHNDPLQRPSAEELLQRLQDMKTQIESPYDHLTKLEMMRKVEDKDVKSKQLQLDLDTLKQKCDTQLQENEKLLSQLEQLQMHNNDLEQQLSKGLQSKDRLELELEAVKQKCDEWQQKGEKLIPLQQELKQLQTQLSEAEEQNGLLKVENYGLSKQLPSSDVMLQFQDEATLRAQLKQRDEEVEQLLRQAPERNDVLF